MQDGGECGGGGVGGTRNGFVYLRNIFCRNNLDDGWPCDDHIVKKRMESYIYDLYFAEILLLLEGVVVCGGGGNCLVFNTESYIYDLYFTEIPRFGI